MSATPTIIRLSESRFPAWAAISAVLIAVALAGRPVEASPLFSIGEGGDRTWTQAIADGNVRAVDPFLGDFLTDPAVDFYTGQVGFGNFQLEASTLTPDLPVLLGAESHTSLVMQWDPPPVANTLSIAAWEYVYDLDPDLSGTKIEFSLGVPAVNATLNVSAIWDVSIELIDSIGRARGWFLSMPPVGWSQHTIDVDAGAQGNFSFFEDLGFDVSQVVAIRLDESGAQVNFPLPPAGAPPLPVQWNAWNHLRVVPEPTTALLVGFGLVVLLAGVRRF